MFPAFWIYWVGGSKWYILYSITPENIQRFKKISDKASFNLNSNIIQKWCKINKKIKKYNLKIYETKYYTIKFIYGHSFFLKLKSYKLHFLMKKIIEFFIIFDCTLPLIIEPNDLSWINNHEIENPIFWLRTQNFCFSYHAKNHYIFVINLLFSYYTKGICKNYKKNIYIINFNF